jgi:hypothetical protein
MDANVVGVPTIEAPKVTAAAIQDGVKLEWNAVIDTTNYTIFRRETAGGADVQVSPSGGSSYSTDPATGKYVWRDLQKESPDSVKANTKYTYTVVAKANSFKNDARTAVEVTTGATFLAKGTKLEPPQAVTLELLPESNTIKVIVTPGAHGDVVASYSVTIYKDGAYSSSATITYPQTTGTAQWNPNSQSDGKYTAKVTTYPQSSNFYLASDPKESAAVRFESLFGPSSSIYAYSPSVVIGTGAASTTALAYSASINISGLKPGVTYSVERAPVTASGTVGEYAPVVLSKSSSTGADYVDATAADLTPDPLGSLGTTGFYDRTLPLLAGSYQYRLKAVKDTAPQYKEAGGPVVTIDPMDDVSINSINVTKTADADSATYAVTPSINRKGLLPSDGKLVIYWIKGTSSSDKYNAGQKIEFSKDELEAAVVEAKSIDVPDSAAGYVFARAQLEFADSSKNESVSTSWTGDVISLYDSSYAQFK